MRQTALKFFRLSSRRQVAEVVHGPVTRVVVLDERKGPALVRDDPHPHGRTAKVILKNRGLEVRITPS